MYNVILAEDSAKAAGRCMRAFSDALAAWGAVAAHNASLGPQAASGLLPTMTGAAPSAPASNPAQWASDAVARLMEAQRATIAAQTEAFRAVTSWPSAELASNPFGVTGLFTSASPVPGAVAPPPTPRKASAQVVSKPPKQLKPKPAAKPAAKRAKTTKPEAKRSAFLKRPVGEPDDLTQIKGVGPKLAESLQDAGIHHFWQLAALSNADVAKVNERLKLSGRIERDGWIEQARELMSPAKG